MKTMMLFIALLYSATGLAALEKKDCFFNLKAMRLISVLKAVIPIPQRWPFMLNV